MTSPPNLQFCFRVYFLFILVLKNAKQMPLVPLHTVLCAIYAEQQHTPAVSGHIVRWTVT